VDFAAESSDKLHCSMVGSDFVSSFNSVLSAVAGLTDLAEPYPGENPSHFSERVGGQLRQRWDWRALPTLMTEFHDVNHRKA